MYLKTYTVHIYKYMLHCNVCLLRLYSLMTLQIEQRLCQHQQHGIKHKVIMLAIFIVIVFVVVIIKNH